MPVGARAVVDLAALRHNLARARAAAPDSRVMAVIKADGYGHGLLRTTTALAGADAFAVGRTAEAVALREAGFEQPILLLEGPFDPQDLELAARHRLAVALHHESQIELLERARLAAPLTLWLKLDSGMHRIGIPLERAAELHARLAANPNVAPPVGLMTHLACADELDRPETPAQLERFERATRLLVGPRSIANSAGILGWPASRGDWVRPGIMLYGVSPFVGGRAAQEGLRPVMTLTTRLIAINRLQRGDPVGYGGSWVCPEAMDVGVAAIGYGDGYPRHAAPGTPVLVRGARVPLIGRVSMDMITLDLSGLPGARIGDEVVLWGEGLPVEEVAGCADTIAYELLCGVTRRVEFEERDG